MTDDRRKVNAQQAIDDGGEGSCKRRGCELRALNIPYWRIQTSDLITHDAAAEIRPDSQ